MESSNKLLPALREPSRRRADLLSGIGLLVFAALYFQRTFAISAGFASDRLGPTFFPRLLAVLLAVLAAALTLRAVWGRSDPTPLPRVRTYRLLVVFGLTVAWALVLPWLGFLIATPLLLGSVIRFLGIRQWRRVVATALATTLILYLVFGRALNVLLPMGPFGDG